MGARPCLGWSSDAQQTDQESKGSMMRGLGPCATATEPQLSSNAEAPMLGLKHRPRACALGAAREATTIRSPYTTKSRSLATTRESLHEAKKIQHNQK